MEGIPHKVFDRECQVITLREIFEKDGEGNYLNFDATEDRATSQKKYRIPVHQRFNKWSIDAKENILGSVFMNYIIGNLSFSRHADAGGGMGFYMNIEDGQSRLTVFQEYIEDKFRFCGLLFSELSPEGKDRFLGYKFSTDITTPSRSARGSNMVIADHYYENFDRINQGKSLEDNDKYWCRKDKPLVKLAIKLMEDCKEDFPFMKTEKFGTKDKKGKEDRKPLDQFVTLCGALLHHQYKKSYSRHYTHIGDPITPEQTKYISDFMEFYKSIHDTMLEAMPKRDKGDKFIYWNNPGKFLGMIVMDFKDDSTTLEQKKDMWVNILNINRCSDNFMKNKFTLWNDFTDASKKNQEQENIRTRINRVKEFYNEKERISSLYHIEYQENEPE